LPVVIVAAVGLGLVFLWGSEVAGVGAGVCAALLLLGNHLFHTLSTLCMTDGLLFAFVAAAVYCLYMDPWLESRGALVGFSAASAGAILTKGIAGCFPVGLLVTYWLAARPKERPRKARIVVAGGLSAALAAPWFVYQLAVHQRWFWTEHVLVEIFGYGGGTPPQTSHEGPLTFYLVRLAATDPVLLAVAAVSVPGFFAALRRRTAGPTLLACWLGLTTAATLGWQYRNASYLLALLPPLALMAACYGPFSGRRYSPWMLAALCGGFLVKAASPEAPWGLNYRAGTIQPVATALSQYCNEAGSNDLIVVDLADDLYGSTLPLQRLRYAVVGDLPARGDYAMPFEKMGIIVCLSSITWNISRVRSAIGCRSGESIRGNRSQLWSRRVPKANSANWSAPTWQPIFSCRSACCHGSRTPGTRSCRQRRGIFSCDPSSEAIGTACPGPAGCRS